MSHGDFQRQSWHLSKSVPISIITGLIMQALMLVWGASAINSNVNNNTNRITAIESTVAEVWKVTNFQAVQLGRIEEGVDSSKRTIERVERILDDRTSN